MRSTSHCANHPSREARIRCVSCQKWICERCVQEHHDRAYCSARCRRTFGIKHTASRIGRLLVHPIPPAWSIALVTAVCLLVTAGVLRLGVELLATWSVDDWGIVEVAVPTAPPSVSGSIVRDGKEWYLEIEGQPKTTVLVVLESRPPIEVTLDGNGRAVVRGEELPTDGSSIRLAPLSPGEATVAPPPTRTPTAVPSATPTMTPSATQTATSTKTSTVTPTQTATVTHSATVPVRATATARPTEVPTPSPTTRLETRTPTEVARAPRRDAPPVLHLVTDAGPRLALTFDGASSSDGTIELLGLLHRLDLRVTLFVTGEYIERYPKIVRRALLAGHEIGNHTFSHPHLTSYATNHRHDTLPGIDRSTFQDQLRRTEAAFRRATGRPMAPLWRAPYGEENSQLRAWAMEVGYLHIRWSSLQGRSLDSLDWVEDEHSSLYVDSSKLVDRLLAFPELEGGIVLMHLSTSRPVPPWSDLPRFVAEVENRGLEVGPVTDLLGHSTRWQPWLEQATARHSEVFGD